jgi:hypothetical protein
VLWVDTTPRMTTKKRGIRIIPTVHRTLDDKLSIAIDSGAARRVRDLLEDGADPSRNLCRSKIADVAAQTAESFHGQGCWLPWDRPIPARLRYENMNIIKVMLEHGVDADEIYLVDATNDWDKQKNLVYMTLLDIAAKSSSYQLVRQLLRHGVVISKDLTKFRTYRNDPCRDLRTENLLRLVTIAGMEVDSHTVDMERANAIGQTALGQLEPELLQHIIDQAKQPVSSLDIDIQGLIGFTDQYTPNGVKYGNVETYEWI